MKTTNSNFRLQGKPKLFRCFLIALVIPANLLIYGQEPRRIRSTSTLEQSRDTQEAIIQPRQRIPLHQLEYHALPQDSPHSQPAAEPVVTEVPQISPATRYVRPNLKENLHVIEDTMATVPIRVIENNQVKEINRPVSGFQLSEGQNLAVIMSRPVTEMVESKGSVEAQNQQIKLEGVALPEIYLARTLRRTTAPGSSGVATEAAVLRVLVDTLPVLRFDPARQYYSGEFQVMLLEDSKQWLTTNQLVEAIPLQFSSSIADFEPAMIAINHTNVPTTTIRIVDHSPQNPVPVKIITRFNPYGYVTHLAKQALLRFDTEPGKIQGMGIQAAPVYISLQNYLGNDSVRVHFVASQGIVDPDTLYLTKDRAGKVLLKSQGTGQAKLTANAPGFMPETIIFRFEMPWMFVLLTLVGGVLGAILKYLMKPEKGKLLPGIAKGFLAGLVVGLLYYLTGFDVLNLNLGREYYEFAVILLALVGALFWEQVYDKLARLVGKE